MTAEPKQIAGPRTILVIEDDEEIRELLAEFLIEEGYPVVTASDGLKGLDVLPSIDRPGLVLLDRRMPVLDGSQFMATLRDRGGLESLAVFVISGLNDRPLPGTCGVIRKPFDLGELLNVVRTNCGLATPAGAA